MQELQIVDEQKINKIYELITTDELTRESFEKDLLEATEKYKGYIATASTLKDDKVKRAEFNKIAEAKNRIRIDTKNALSETAITWDNYAKSIIKPFEDMTSELDKSIKAIEEHQKTLRLDTVKSYLANKASEYMLDPRIFDEKATEYIKAGDFMADGVTLKKATMKSLDDMVTFEYQKQQEHEKAKRAISGQCAEYNMTDQPYIRMLRDLTLAEVLEQIKSDYHFEQERQKAEQARLEREQRLAEEKRLEEEQQKAQAQVRESPAVDPETGEILESDLLHPDVLDTTKMVENEPEKYTQSMTLKVFFKNSDEKERFKATLATAGFRYQYNYWVEGYKKLDNALTQEELESEFRS